MFILFGDLDSFFLFFFLPAAMKIISSAVLKTLSLLNQPNNMTSALVPNAENGYRFVLLDLELCSSEERSVFICNI